jgi:hypothetical protein
MKLPLLDDGTKHARILQACYLLRVPLCARDKPEDVEMSLNLSHSGKFNHD